MDRRHGRLCIGQADSKPLRDGFRCFRKLGKRKTFFAPTMDSTFEYPNVLDAYSFQCQRCLRAHDLASRRAIENDYDMVGYGNPRRIPQPGRIDAECTRDCRRAFNVGLFLEVQQIEQRDLAAGSQLLMQHRRADEADPQLANHSYQSKSAPANVNKEWNTDRKGQG